MGRSLRGLRRLGRMEIGLAGVTLVASALLTSLVPPVLAQAAARQPAPARTVALASSQGPGVRATLEVSPGYPGQNRFTLRAYDPATSRTLVGDVTLRFQMPSRPDTPESTLALARATDGSYTGLGSNISLVGDWVVTALVRQGTGPTDIPFQVTCSPSPQELQQMTIGSQPMAYGIRLANGWRLQAYLRPGRPGRDTLHLAFTEQRNGPVGVPGSPRSRPGRAAPPGRCASCAWASAPRPRTSSMRSAPSPPGAGTSTSRPAPRTAAASRPASR